MHSLRLALTAITEASAAAGWPSALLAEKLDTDTETVAKTLVVGVLRSRALTPPARTATSWNWLRGASVPELRDLLVCCESLASRPIPQLCALESLPFDELMGWLGSSSQNRRRRHGIYYTPKWLARYVLHEAHQLLIEQFGLAEGLADGSTWQQVLLRHPQVPAPQHARPNDFFVRILDPALGSGVFWTEAIELIHQHLTTKWRREGCGEGEITERWNEYVPKELLPRLYGFELLRPALLATHIGVAAKLAETGFRFEGEARLQAYHADTLSDPATPAYGPEETIRFQLPMTVIVGNPPFASLSTNGSQWMKRLLKGRAPRGEEVANYFECDAQPLGERKLWLHDDYVQFFRYGHWRIESTGCGILALVTNHGYLDNATFRGMRCQLRRTFPIIRITDLHGNAKAHERLPDGRRDENVFGIEQGISVSLLARPFDVHPPNAIRYRELWGTVHHKQHQLVAACEGGAEVLAEVIVPGSSPHYHFVPRRGCPVADREYEQAYPLPHVMPVYTTAPVTARDGLVVAFSKVELKQRLEELADLSIDESVIRERYFPRGRSPRYLPGDTRSWKLRTARQRLARETNWDSYLTTCLYRPFDLRSIFWADWMIDWPRPDVTCHLRASNLALITRRQVPPALPCTFFWVTDRIALDGVVRSDNRGSESLFPLYLQSETHSPNGRGKTSADEGRVNVQSDFLEQLRSRTGLDLQAPGQPASENSFAPEELLGFFYAQFHSPYYRTRYAVNLRQDFPRVFLPRTRRGFHTLAALGCRLIHTHLLREQPIEEGLEWHGEEPVEVARRGPRYAQETILVSERSWVAGVTPERWEFTVGGHQVCRKWLRDRRGRRLSAADMQQFLAILSAVGHTCKLMRDIDATIEDQGGWSEVVVTE